MTFTIERLHPLSEFPLDDAGVLGTKRTLDGERAMVPGDLLRISGHEPASLFRCWSLIAGSRGRICSVAVDAVHRRCAEQGIDVLPNGGPVEPGVLPQP
jgi:hypothetical protein